MNKPGGERESQNTEDQEKYARNQNKFIVTKQKFEELTKTVLEKLEKCETRIERVILDLTLKFSKSVQL